MLIDSSWFTQGSRHIQNANAGNSVNLDSMDVNDAIEAYVTEYQDQFLYEMVGPDIAAKGEDYLDRLGDNAKQMLCESFADYVFFKILGDANTQSKITGLVQLKCADTYVAPIRRQVTVWNRMVDRNKRFAALTGISVNENLLTKINCLNL